MSEFTINNYLKLKLENDITYIYVNDVQVHQCKYLLLNLPKEDGDNLQEKQQDFTMDEQASNLDHSLELRENFPLEIPPETEFWAHCSNLQAWYENNYDTRVLHSNLAFPLLKRLTEAGDEQAKQVFKDEIMKRFRSGNLNVMTFLIKEEYLKRLSIEEWEELHDELSFETYKELQKRLRELSKIQEGFQIDNSSD